MFSVICTGSSSGLVLTLTTSHTWVPFLKWEILSSLQNRADGFPLIIVLCICVARKVFLHPSSFLSFLWSVEQVPSLLGRKDGLGVWQGTWPLPQLEASQGAGTWDSTELQLPCSVCPLLLPAAFFTSDTWHAWRLGYYWHAQQQSGVISGLGPWRERIDSSLGV